MTDSIAAPTDTFQIGDRVAYVETAVKPRGCVYTGTVHDIDDDGEVYVHWDDHLDDRIPWPPNLLHPVLDGRRVAGR